MSISTLESATSRQMLDEMYARGAAFEARVEDIATSILLPASLGRFDEKPIWFDDKTVAQLVADALETEPYRVIAAKLLCALAMGKGDAAVAKTLIKNAVDKLAEQNVEIDE